MDYNKNKDFQKLQGWSLFKKGYKKGGPGLFSSPGKYEKENIYAIKKVFVLCLIINIPGNCDGIVTKI